MPIPRSFIFEPELEQLLKETKTAVSLVQAQQEVVLPVHRDNNVNYRHVHVILSQILLCASVSSKRFPIGGIVGGVIGGVAFWHLLVLSCIIFLYTERSIHLY